jgi:hypothetical protein
MTFHPFTAAPGPRLSLALLAFLPHSVCAEPVQRAPIALETGVASWYGAAHEGRRTAAGTIFHMDELTAAHRSMPFGARARVTNLENGRSVEVVVNDRGPAVPERILDLSASAATELGIRSQGSGARLHHSTTGLRSDTTPSYGAHRRFDASILSAGVLAPSAAPQVPAQAG